MSSELAESRRESTTQQRCRNSGEVGKTKTGKYLNEEGLFSGGKQRRWSEDPCSCVSWYIGILGTFLFRGVLDKEITQQTITLSSCFVTQVQSRLTYSRRVDL